MSDMTPGQVIAQVAEWRDHEVRYEVLGGGITNHNYLVTVDGEPFISSPLASLRKPWATALEAILHDEVTA